MQQYCIKCIFSLLLPKSMNWKKSRRAFIAKSTIGLGVLASPTSILKHFSMAEQTNFDVIIVGGSYAGLSAAMALGRSLRSTLIIDSGQPCNRQTPHSHNFLTQDGATPQAISKLAREQLQTYETVSFYEDIAVSGTRLDSGFSISTQSGATFTGKKLVFTTGIKDVMPDINGFKACWGISVIHCPYCHGYEYHGQKTAILANGEHAYHLASLVDNLTKDLTILTAGKASFTESQRVKLANHDIQILESPVETITHKKGSLESVLLQDGTKLNLTAMYASIPFLQHCDIPVELGCEMTEEGYIKVDDFYRTSMEGIYACGDNVTRFRSVANAVASGNATGALINMALVEEAF